MSTLAIVQARLGSLRLPNKVLLEINGEKIIDVVLHRLELCQNIDKIIVATGSSLENEPLINHLQGRDINVFVGSEHDVLKRFLQCAEKNKAQHIVRITADCPLIDPEIIDAVVKLYKKTEADYCSNTLPPTYPDGLDVEVFSIEALRLTEKLASDKTDREHVTRYMRNTFKNIVNLRNEVDLSDFRMTVDEQADYEFLQSICENSKYLSNVLWQDVVKGIKSGLYKDLLKSGVQRNEGAEMTDGQKLYKRAKSMIPGGTMLLSKRPEMFLPGKWPSYFSKASGCKIWDLDQNELLDMSIMGIGTNTLGYGHPFVDQAVQGAIKNGNLSTLNCPEEVWLAEELLKMNSWAGGVRFARTGGEANAIAVRIARAAVGKEGIAVCGYHGWHDWYLSANLGTKDELNRHLLPGLSTSGVPESLAGTIYGFAYNDFDELTQLLDTKNIGVVKMEVQRSTPPIDDFLLKVRKLCDDRGVILIFDECTSGFRETYGGLFQKYQVEPDLSIFGKTIGNGYALTAIVGKAEIMDFAETTFISSTFWTERIGPCAALATLQVMREIESWNEISKIGKNIKNFWKDTAQKYDYEIETFGLDSLAGFTVICDKPMHIKTFITQELLKNNILGSNMIYTSIAHEQKYLDRYFDEFDKIAQKIPIIIENSDYENVLEGPVCHSGFSRLN